MSTIIMNDVAMEAKVGERVLNVARRNAAHIGFLCDNAGTCQLCRCQVQEGAEYLSPPSEAEKAWIPEAKLAEGQRLACQLIVREQGEVKIQSYAEYIRQLVLTLVDPPPSTNTAQNLEPLVKNLLTDFADQLALFPRNILSRLNELGPVRFAFPIQDTDRFVEDMSRLVERMNSGVERIERKPRETVKSSEETLSS
ncbi:2Fe-2S iron-sulfur cluster-binding protein [Candidatus Chloroploca asiatica]|uniref:2Fe-2S ferredoxin-type domain-containing protein n=1 Tax=Candidatus Chloroploca asiatica TaxID=1506545 RepID=A0A2H3KZT7_9CHLR|nr:2Fe-2S iron-sulfur cluster-binding protein [Candidatus Chloroploca asiatica]PDV96407.1 hypothetical protein A9Q02_06835 [Candidatus Chloroploca asiatica]